MRAGFMGAFALIVKATRLMPEQVATSYGLMQLMLPLAWGYLSAADKLSPIQALYDPDKNIRYGAAHLAALIKGRPISGRSSATLPANTTELAATALMRAMYALYGANMRRR